MPPTLQFLGAAKTVTGSKYLLQTDGSQVLVDCGLFQGEKELRERNWNPLPVDPRRINAVVMTHAHIDHIGYLPRLVQQGFSGPVFCTPATQELTNISLPDSGHLQEEEARFANKKGYSKHAPAAKPLYTKEDAVRSLNLISTLDYDSPSEIAKGVRLTFRPTGHILGAAFAEIAVEGRRLVMSGDVGGYKSEVMRAPAPIPDGTDYVAVESTYGGRSIDPRPVAQQLKEHIKPTLDAGGVVVLPAFAVGRTTLVLYYLRQLQDRGEIPDVPVYVDSPMATDAVEIYCRYGTEHNLKADLLKDSKTCPIRARTTHLVRSPQDSIAINDMKGPMIIIAASGMATGGRILHHLLLRLPDPKNLVMLVGYQAAGTRGRSLLEGAKELKLLGEMVPVKAKVASINGLSAHGDADDMIRWLSTAKKKPKRAFLVHGEPDALAAMDQRISSELGFERHIPDYMEKVAL